MLAGTGLGDDVGLAHAPGQQRLAQGVVELMSPGVVEVLALEPQLRSTQVFREARGVAERGGAAGPVAEQFLELGVELGIFAYAVPGAAQLVVYMCF